MMDTLPKTRVSYHVRMPNRFGKPIKLLIGESMISETNLMESNQENFAFNLEKARPMLEHFEKTEVAKGVSPLKELIGTQFSVENKESLI